MADNLVKGLGAGDMELAKDFELTDSSGTTTFKITQAGVMSSTSALETSSGNGTKNGSTVSVVEKGDGVLHQTVITLASTPCPIVSVTTGAGVGGIKVYDAPEGHWRLIGATASLSLLVGSAKEADYTDNTPEGDYGVGTVTMANADTFGTDATDDYICTGKTFTMTTFAQAAQGLAPEAAANFDGTTTAKDIVVNCLVDAADVDDDVTSEIEVSGTITLTWINLGDV